MDNKEVTEENEWNDTNANVYALTKRAAEMEVWRASQEGLSIAIVNPGVILGPGFWKTGSGALFSTAAKGRGYYPPGGTGFITVHDVVKMMIGIMNSSIVNERFVAVSENFSFLDILSKLTKNLNKPKPYKKLKFWQLEILWRLDWLQNTITKRSRRLTKNSVLSLRDKQIFSNAKIREMLDFKFEPLEGTIQFSCSKFLEEHF